VSRKQLLEFYALPTLAAITLALGAWIWAMEGKVIALENGQRHLVPVEHFAVISTKLDSQKETLDKIETQITKISDKLNQHMEGGN
jgi:hypothetical protein